MNVVFRVECYVEAGHVEIMIDNLPFTPVIGMRIAPHPSADLLRVDEVYWLAEKPNVLEVWLVEEGDGVSPWSYFKKQGYKKGGSA